MQTRKQNDIYEVENMYPFYWVIETQVKDRENENAVGTRAVSTAFSSSSTLSRAFL